MYDLLKKLNTLVSAQVNDAISRLPNLERKPDLDRQVSELRQRVSAALEHEDKLRAQVGTLQTEIAGLDSRIDAAIAAGQEVTARGLLEEVQRLQKRLALAESDLRQHQNSAADLIIKVNELEAVVGEIKAAPAANPTASAPQPHRDNAPAHATKGSITDFMPPRQDETPQAPVKSAQETKTPETVKPETTAAQPESMPPVLDTSLLSESPSGAVELPPPADSTPKAKPAAPKPQAEPEEPERKPWDKPRTAKEAAEWAREDAEEARERTETGVEQVGGLLRDIQSRVNQRMGDLDRMLQEGGLTDETGAPKPIPTTPPADKPKANPEDDLNDRLSRLTKPE